MIIALLLPLALAAEEAPARKKIGVVLSGGGARGAAHIGVLKVLEEMHVPVDLIVGTSMGAVVGGLYSSGVPLVDLERMCAETDWEGVFTDSIPRRNMSYRDRSGLPNYFTSVDVDPGKGLSLPRGLVNGKRLDLLLRSLTFHAPDDFLAFPIPFSAVASDIGTGRMVVLSQGSLARAIRASMAIPGVFEPVEIDGRLLVDGGVAQNLGIEVAKSMGADVVIAVNIGTPLRKSEELTSFVAVIDQITNILTNRNVTEQLHLLEQSDLLIEPDLGPITTADFDRMPQAVKKGEMAARTASERLVPLAVSAEDYQAFRARQLERSTAGRRIEFIRMEQKSLLGSDFVIRVIGKSAGNILRRDVLAYDLFELYKRGDFEDIGFDPLEENGRQGLLIRTKERSGIRSTVSFGMEISSQVRQDNNFRILAGYTASNLNRLGAKWKNEFCFGRSDRFFSEFSQPLNPYTWHVFAAPSAEYLSYPVSIYDDFRDDHALSEYRVDEGRLGLDLGVHMGEYAEARFGFSMARARSKLDIGVGQRPEEKTDKRAYKVELNYDRLDNVYFPTQGGLATARYFYGRENLGSDDNYESVETSLVSAFSLGRHTVILRGRWDTNFDSANSLSQGYFLGGFLNLSGLNIDQLRGNHLALAEVVYLARVMKLSKLIGRDLHAGFSLESGSAWADRSDISSRDLIHAGSVFLGVDTNIGPIYLAYGHAEGGCNALYFMLGVRQF